MPRVGANAMGWDASRSMNTSSNACLEVCEEEEGGQQPTRSSSRKQPGGTPRGKRIEKQPKEMPEFPAAIKQSN